MAHGNSIKVAFFGAKTNLKDLQSHLAPDWELSTFDIVYCDEKTDINTLITLHNPDIFCSFGDWSKYKNLTSMPNEVLNKWISFGSESLDIGEKIMDFFISSTFSHSKDDAISIVTPTFNIKDRIWKTYNSLTSQTFQNWEWLIIDDSTDNETYNLLKAIESADCRVKLFKNKRNTGKIGGIKRSGFELASHKFIAELDHDDCLTEKCLEWVVKTFNKYPEAGMCYTDCIELFEETGESLMYGSDFAFGYGSYRKENYKGKEYNVTNYPHLNSLTIRHIVGVPNHIRAWRKSVYNDIGGHNRALHVVDDYELIIRTFLHSKIAHIPKFGYIQNILPNKSNTTDVRRSEIQRLVKFIQQYYDKEIHNRILELGYDDFVWNDSLNRSDIYKDYEKSNQNFYITSDVK
jgi:glycosyltransferase involved in cell wall biosynthesis